MKKLLMLALLIPCMSFAGLAPAQEKIIAAFGTAFEQALEEGNVRSVQNILNNLKDRNITLDEIRVGKYNDTPLGAAIRTYGQRVQKQVVGDSRSGRLGFALCTAALASSLTGLGMYVWKQDIALSSFISTMSIPVYFYSFLFFYSLRADPVRRIITALITTNNDLLVRNREGITPVDIAKAYEPYALQLHDEWYQKFVEALAQTSMMQLQQQNSATVHITIKQRS